MEKSLLRNQQKSAMKFGRNDEIVILNSYYLYKSNLNYLECEDYEGLTLLTLLT